MIIIGGRTSTSRWMSCVTARVWFILHITWSLLVCMTCSVLSYKIHIYRRGMCVCCNDAEIALTRWRHEGDKNGFYDAPRLRPLYFIRTWRRSGSWLQSDAAFEFEYFNNIFYVYVCLYFYRQRSSSERMRKYCLFLLQWRNITGRGGGCMEFVDF